MIKNIINWFALSSAEPGKTALTVKGLLVGGVAAITYLAGIGHITLPSPEITAAVDGITNFVQAALVAVSSAMTVWGLIRKVYLTFKGEHQSL
jgi:hypothetical protein